MDENVLAASALGLDEPVALSWVEPFHSASGHVVHLRGKTWTAQSASLWPVKSASPMTAVIYRENEWVDRANWVLRSERAPSYCVNLRSSALTTMPKCRLPT